MKNKSNKIVLINILSTVILQGLSFISAPIFSRMLGTANYGIVSVYTTWVSIFSTVYSLQAASTFAVARKDFPLEDQEKYQSSVISLGCLSYTLFAIATILLLIPLSHFFDINVILITFALIQGLGAFVIGAMNLKFTYEFKPDKNLIISVLVSVMNIGLSYLFITHMNATDNYWGRILGQLIPNALMGLILYIYIFSKGKTFKNAEYWKYTLAISIPTIFHLLANLILGQSDRLMIQQMMNNSSVGIYTLAANFGAIVNTIYGALNNSWVPFYYEYTRTGQIDTMLKHAKNYIELFAIIIAGFVLLTPEVYHVFAGKEYWGGTGFITWFAVGYYFVFLYSFPVNYEFYHTQTKSIARVTMTAAIFNIVFNYILIKRIGILGAVISTVVSYILQFVLHYMNARKIESEEFPFRLRMFIPGIIFVTAIALLATLLDSFWIVRWCIAAVLGIYLLYKMWKRRAIF